MGIKQKKIVEAALWALAWGCAGLSSAWAQIPMENEPKWARGLQDQRRALEAQARAWDSDKFGAAPVEVPTRALGKKGGGKEALLLCLALEARGFGACDPSMGAPTAASLLSRIKAAQDFYGLEQDGLADAQLYNALALPSPSKAELARAASEDLGRIIEEGYQLGASRVVVVNAAAFKLEAHDESGMALESKIVVGRPDRQTPRGMINVTFIKFNPNWTPPSGIMAKDVYPSLDHGGEWIKKHGLVMTDKDGQLVDLDGVGSEEAKSMGYRFTQPAGDYAALGKLKFETDSKDSIYLHDTNERRLFDLSTRARSSGCVRVQRWEDLASWIWGKPVSEVGAVVAKKTTSWQKVNKTPVFIGYRQADIVHGKVVVFPNIYKISKATPRG